LYDPKDPEESDFDNAHGLIASMNDATHKLMQDTMEEIHVTRSGAPPLLPVVSN
jgi:hypothetical protein